MLETEWLNLQHKVVSEELLGREPSVPCVWALGEGRAAERPCLTLRCQEQNYFCFRGTQSQNAIWPENVANVQAFPCAGFARWVYQHFINLTEVRVLSFLASCTSNGAAMLVHSLHWKGEGGGAKRVHDVDVVTHAVTDTASQTHNGSVADSRVHATFKR